MATIPLLPQAKFWQSDNWEDAPHFRFLRIKTHYQRISNPLSYCLLTASKMTDIATVGETFANTIGAHYFDLLMILCDHCWSTSGVTIDIAEISKLFKNETQRKRITEALNGKIKSNEIIPTLYLLSRQSILNTVTDIRELEKMDSLPEHIREIILLPRQE